VKKGSADRAEAIDVAPTLARILGVQPPEACEGRVLSEALLP
jgi:arylsulfatase A-like enzyme